MLELKPCPFCGGEATVQIVSPIYMKRNFKGRFVAAGCRQCGAATAIFNANNKTGSPLRNKAHEETAKKQAALVWNRRAGHDDK